MGDLGTIGVNSLFVAQQEGWGRGMNVNLIKMGIMMHPSAKSKTTAIPSSGSEGDVYIDPATSKIFAWIGAFDDGVATPAQWWSGTPSVGTMMYVQDVDGWFMIDITGTWQPMFDQPHNPVQRELAFYIPGNIRPNTAVFTYTAGMELTIPAGSPGGAFLETAPTSAFTINLTKNGTTFGTLSFAAGSVDGTLNIPTETIIQPATPEETIFIKANSMRIVTPANLYGATGLTMTLRGKVRSID